MKFIGGAEGAVEKQKWIRTRAKDFHRRTFDAAEYPENRICRLFDQNVDVKH